MKKFSLSSTLVSVAVFAIGFFSSMGVIGGSLIALRAVQAYAESIAK